MKVYTVDEVLNYKKNLPFIKTYPTLNRRKFSSSEKTYLNFLTTEKLRSFLDEHNYRYDDLLIFEPEFNALKLSWTQKSETRCKRTLNATRGFFNPIQMIDRIDKNKSVVSSSETPDVYHFEKIKTNAFVFDEQVLYLMINQLGHLKIGISKHPISRANSLANSSGTEIHVIGIWKVGKEARKVETFIHKKYYKNRRKGEWFDFNAMYINDVETSLEEYALNSFTMEWDRVYIRDILSKLS